MKGERYIQTGLSFVIQYGIVGESCISNRANSQKSPCGEGDTGGCSSRGAGPSHCEILIQRTVVRSFG